MTILDRKHTLLILNVTLTACCVLFLLWMNDQGQKRRRLPALQNNGHPLIYQAKTQQEVYDLYRRNGLWGAKVVHLNRFLNMADYSPPEEARTAPYPLRPGDARALYEQGLDAHNWLFVASITGMVRTVIAVLPSEVLSERLEAFRSEPFFSTDGRAVRGYSNDVPMRVVELADLPACNEPVVVNVDAGYFTAETDPPASARMLKERCPDVRMLILVGSVDEPEVTAGMRDALQAFAAAWRDK